MKRARVVPQPSQLSPTRVERVVQQASPLGDTTAMQAAISLAQIEGRRARLRVQLPCIVLGVTLFAGGAALGVAMRDTIVGTIGLLMQVTGVVGVVLAVLPADERLVFFASGAVVFSTLIASTVLAATVLAPRIGRYNTSCTAAADGSSQSTGDGACWELMVEAILPAFHIAALIFFGVGVGRAALRRGTAPRVLLESIWRYMARLIAAISMVIICRFVIVTALLGAPPGSRQVPAAGVLLGILAIAIRKPTLRIRIQSLLAARGEALLTAASVAAFIGNAPAAEMIVRAQATFRVVPLSSVLSEHLESNEPDPRLFALSQPAVLGQCDAFIRCEPARKRAPIPVGGVCTSWGVSVRPWGALHPHSLAVPRVATTSHRPHESTLPFAPSVRCSHSWTDEPAKKFEALLAWGYRFEQHFKRTPLVWLDRTQPLPSSSVHCPDLYFSSPPSWPLV